MLFAVAFNGNKRSVFPEVFHQAHMIQIPVAVAVKEDQISRQCFLRLGIDIHTEILQHIAPCLARRVLRHIRHLGIFQAEGNKHGIPLAIGIPIPAAVAGIAIDCCSVFLYYVVPGALPVAQLRPRDGQQVLPVESGNFHIPEGLLPLARVFHIRLGVGVADEDVGMDFLLAGQLPLAVAEVRMLMFLRFLQGASQRILRDFTETALSMGVAAGHFIAAVLMDMGCSGFITRIRVNMGFHLLQGADQLRCRFRRQLGVTRHRVLVFPDAAEGFLLLCDGRQRHNVDRSQCHCAAQHQQATGPYPPASPSLIQLFRTLNQPTVHRFLRLFNRSECIHWPD